MSPYYSMVERGEDVGQAWERAMPAIQGNMQLGVWKKDIMAGTAGSSRIVALPEVQCAPCCLPHHASDKEACTLAQALP